MATTLPDRKDIAKERTWDEKSVFASDEDMEAALQAVIDRLPEFDEFKGKLADGPGVISRCFRLIDELHVAAGKVRIYAMLRHSVDMNDQQAAALNDKSIGLFARMQAATSFLEPELLAIGAEQLRQWATEHPDLKGHYHYFDVLGRKSPHVRSAEVEQLLGLVMDPFYTAASVHDVIADADMTFADAVDGDGNHHPVGQGNWEALWHSADRELRRTAWENYADSYIALKNGLANALAAGLKQHVFITRARRYNSALEAALSQGHIPTEVFHNLIDTYKKHLPVWHRYWRVRKKALGVDALHPYDVRAVLTDKDPKVSYEQAVDWICEGMAPLGDEYVSAMRRGCLEDRWVDVYPNKGKRSGAFSTGSYGTRPFILMSYTDDLLSVSTLAHELGHSMHSYYTRKTQPPVYARYGLFVAEVASNFNQALVRKHLFETNDDPDFQIALIEEAMGNFHRYFFIMPTLARFEAEMYERLERGEAVTADVMTGRLADLFAEGYGDEVIYGDERGRERAGIAWAQFPHLYAPFYVYQYATGISGAHALANRVLSGEAGSAEAYIEFLKAGGSEYPLDVLRKAGVDLSSPEPVEETYGVLEGLVDRLEKLVDEK